MRERLLASTMIVGAIAVAGAGQAAAQAVQTAPGASAQPAFGPQTPATLGNATGQSAESASTVQTVTVTGSLIRRPGLTSSAPIATVSQQEFKLEGTTDAVDVLDELPQNGTMGLNNAPNPLNGSGGFTEADLRNLGAVRTLVLQDGRRLQPGDPTLGGEAADLDTVPQQLVQRVDVLTGGSSTTYGSDAVAGVVNFIMKHDFQGVSFDIQYGADWHDNDDTNVQRDAKLAGFPVQNSTQYDGQNFTASLAVGANSSDGRGNVEGYLNYRHQDPVYDNSRDFASCETASTGSRLVCVGSSNSNFFQDNNSAHGSVYSVSGNTFVPFGSLSNQPTTYPTGTVYNANGLESLSRQDDRYQGGFFANYKVLPQAELYGEFGFTDDRSQSQAAPSAVFRGPTYTLACNDPLLSAQEKSTLVCTDGNYSLTIGRRDVEGGPRQYSFEHESYRGVGGVRGDLGEGWHYDAYAQYGYTSYQASTKNDLSINNIQNGLNDCVGATNACVPYNIFSNGGVTQAALNYIKELGTQSGDTEEQVVHAGLTGQLGQYGITSPFAHDGVAVAVGTEYRREALVFQPDAAEQSGDLSGSGGANPAVSGNFDVYELFGELDVPIVQDRPFMKSIDFDTAYRFSDYSEAGITNTYKFGVNYAPDGNILFRGSFNRAVRAPNTNELFTPATATNGTYADPCAVDPTNPKSTATATLAQCELTGVTAAKYGNGGTTDAIKQCASNQCSVSTGGNLNLKPEQADTVTFGGVFTPKFLPQYFRNLDISIDYFHIDLKNAISTVAPQTIINECIAGINSYCSLIHRNPQSEELLTQALVNQGYVEGTGLNIGRLKTSGIDFEGNYRYNIADLGYGDFGRLSFNYSATYTEHFIDIPAPGIGFYDCAGYYGTVCGVQPRFRSKFRISYTSPYKFTVSGQWRFTGPMRLDSNQPNPLITSGSIDARDGNIHSTGYFDLTATYQVRDGLVLRAGMNNIFDKDPPVLAGASAVATGLPNTFPSFDELGRELFVGLSADF